MKNKILASLLSAVILLSGCSDSQSNPSETNADGSADAGSSSSYEFGQLAMGGGGFVSGIIANPAEENVIYARTDVGGAYKWNASTGEWKCMSFNISAEDVGLLSIDGIAVDENHPGRVYMVAGCSYFSNGKTAILISNDYGETFEIIDVSDLIKVHGNGMGRQNGERIAVDPNNSDIIYCGGRTGGLIKSTDAGKTWARVESTPVKATSNSVGINCIVFDKTSVSGGATQRIFLSASQKGEDNIFVSEDGGATWNAVSGLTTEYMPLRMRLDTNSNLLITYAGAEGPHDTANGAIYKYNINDKTATDITPEAGHPYGDVVFDPANPDRLVAVTINTWVLQSNGSYGDIFFTSTDGGATWKNVNESMTMNANNCQWVGGYAIHWCGCLMLNPYNTDQIMVVSGNGVFAADNIWSDTVDFYFNAHGIEETVPLDIVSIPGGPLVTSIGDYDGCVYEDTSTYGTLHTIAVGTTPSIAVGGENNEVWAKVGNDSSKFQFYVSTDSGATWNRAKSPKSGENPKAGKIAVSADGKTIVWSPENTFATYYTNDLGETWNECAGLSDGMYVMADTVNSDYFYAAGNSTFYVSSDGGKTFAETFVSLKSSIRFAQPYGIEGKIILPLGASIAVSTDHGQNFEILKTVNSVTALGVGKASADDKPYVIYMWGEADSQGVGIYASEDDGQTWKKLSDDQHQFGGTGNANFIIGDMNEYGKFYMSTVGLGVIYGKLAQ